MVTKVLLNEMPIYLITAIWFFTATVFMSACLETYPLYKHQIYNNGNYSDGSIITTQDSSVTIQIYSIRTTEGLTGFHATDMFMVIENHNNYPVQFLTDKIKLESKFYDYNKYEVTYMEEDLKQKKGLYINLPPKSSTKIELIFYDISANGSTYTERDLLRKRMHEQWLKLCLPGVVGGNDTLDLPPVNMVPEVALEEK